MKLYRIVSKQYVDSAWNGQGAAMYGGRWNSLGVPMVYTSPSLSLAVLEVLVHLKSPRRFNNFVTLELEMSESDLMMLPTSELAEDWRYNEIMSRGLGDTFIESESAAGLMVPSFIVPLEHNVLVNPTHPVVLESIKNAVELKYQIDPRLI
ncbi:RES family NAD+ phosphorylase [Shewanella baltica]|uniref:RES family NAD+ phosphorylase n=1 Tax=Shewanella baltica TaxID=62322 RepID=UPI0039B08092